MANTYLFPGKIAVRCFLAGLLLALSGHFATVRGAATAILTSSQPTITAGTQATLTGRNFAPGETVAFSVTHLRGTPTLGTNHTPAQVVADPGGAFTATWLVCSNDCVGEMLRVEATGQSSGRVGDAVILGLPAAPARLVTWVRTDKADYAPGTTANIKGGGFGAGEAVVLQVVHADGTPDTGTDHEPWSVTANAAGGYQSTWQVCTDDCLHSTLKLTAAGQTSGKRAQAIFTDAGGAPTFELIKSFGTPSPGGDVSGLVQGPGGMLYGVASSGGGLGYGTLFKMNPDGSGYTVLKSFDYTTTGGYPTGRLLLGADGALYGVASYGGSGGSGTVFKINPDGSGFAVVVNFDYSTTGAAPESALVQGADGVIYGTSYYGGSGGYGTVYKLNPDGTSFAAIKSFDDFYATGAHPQGSVILGTDGMLYGTTSEGGTDGYGGTVYKVNTDGTGFTVLLNFDSTTGIVPEASLLQAADGMLYGTTVSGGTDGYGTLFKLNTDGTGFTVLINFDYSTAGAYPYAGLVQGSDGELYGTASQGGGGVGWYGTVFKLNTDGTGLTVLQVFDNYYVTGAYVFAGLLLGTDGTVYGATSSGGIAGAGTVFRLNSDGGGFSLLKSFSSGPDVSSGGGYPQGRLLQGADGKLYGTTTGGGTGSYGTVFKLNADGTGFTVLKNVDTYGSPHGGLMQAADGALYGTTEVGGSSGFGTVFKLNSDGTGFIVLKNFDYSTTGGYLESSLVQGPDGALYGTAGSGGGSYNGTVFKLNTDGTGFTVLKNFDYSTTGGSPYGGLVLGADGVLYGAADFGGASDNGTVYRLNTDGSGFAVLQGFDYYTTGGQPQSALIQGADGLLYGTTSSGGINSYGTLFKLNTDGTGFAVLQNLDSLTTGRYPNGSLLQDTDGTLYGHATAGGSEDAGTLFKLNTDGTGFAVVYNFDFSSGAYPYGGLVRGTDGNLYGTTTQGGDANAGTVFRLVFPPTVPPNNPPVAMCKNVTVSAGVNCTANAAIDNGSFDPDTGDTITLAQAPPGPYPLGNTLVTLTVTDSHGASNSCSSTVTVVDTTPPSITCPASISVGCSLVRLAIVTFPAPTVSDTCDPNPTVTCTPASGTASFPVGVTTVVCRAVDAAGNPNTCSFTVTRAALGFTGFLSPIGGEVALGTGGSFADPLRAFKFGSTIPIKFSANCGGSPVSSGVHTLQMTKYSSAVDSDTAIDATPTDAATTGNQFQLTDATTGEWHFNLSTKPLSVGTWKLTATLSDGSVHEVWISIKK